MARIVTQFYTHFYNSRVGKIALVTMDNGEDYKKPTTFDEEGLSSLNRALDTTKRVVTVELNATGQLSTLIRANTGRVPDAQVLKYDGRSFTPDYIVRALESTRPFVGIQSELRGRVRTVRKVD